MASITWINHIIIVADVIPKAYYWFSLKSTSLWGNLRKQCVARSHTSGWQTKDGKKNSTKSRVSEWLGSSKCQLRSKWTQRLTSSVIGMDGRILIILIHKGITSHISVRVDRGTLSEIVIEPQKSKWLFIIMIKCMVCGVRHTWWIAVVCLFPKLVRIPFKMCMTGTKADDMAGQQKAGRSHNL